MAALLLVRNAGAILTGIMLHFCHLLCIILTVLALMLSGNRWLRKRLVQRMPIFGPLLIPNIQGYLRMAIVLHLKLFTNQELVLWQWTLLLPLPLVLPRYLLHHTLGN